MRASFCAEPPDSARESCAAPSSGFLSKTSFAVPAKDLKRYSSNSAAAQEMFLETFHSCPRPAALEVCGRSHRAAAHMQSATA
eukprot:6193474-Pleurochrysis_carterae.AAC.5